MSHISAEPQTLSQYHADEPHRLPADCLAEGQLFHLMMRNDGKGPEAYLAPVYLASIQRALGKVSLEVFYTDPDLKPLNIGLPSIVEGDYWIPDRPLPLTSRRARGESRVGYFKPYTNNLDLDFFIAMQGRDTKIGAPS